MRFKFGVYVRICVFSFEPVIARYLLYALALETQSVCDIRYQCRREGEIDDVEQMLGPRITERLLLCALDLESRSVCDVNAMQCNAMQCKGEIEGDGVEQMLIPYVLQKGSFAPKILLCYGRVNAEEGEGNDRITYILCSFPWLTRSIYMYAVYDRLSVHLMISLQKTPYIH